MSPLQQALVHARSQALQLFARIERDQLIRPGETEASISAAIAALAEQHFATRTHWHRRMVRVGPNTRLQFKESAPDRAVTSDDIVSIDLGPVFDEFEADFGDSYVLGSDPEKLRLRSDLRPLFNACREHYLQHPAMTGAELYAHVVDACAARGWGFGGAHAGHLVGAFPLSKAERDSARNRIRPDNHEALNAPDAHGQARVFVLEIHLLDPSGQFGGFFEDLLLDEAAYDAPT